MIPKVIHYCWFGGKKLPLDVRKCIKSWKKYCPDYEIVQWDESNFDVRQNKFVSQAYASRAWAFVSDYARLKIIYDMGGVYLDTDVELIKKIDELLKDDCFLATQAEPQRIATGLGFGAVKGHSAIEKMLKEYEDLEFNIEERNSFMCPILNTNPFINIGYVPSNEIQQVENAIIYPSRYFDPINSDGFNITNETVSIHHYSATWESGVHRIKRKVAITIGPRMEGLIKKNMKKRNSKI